GGYPLHAAQFSTPTQSGCGCMSPSISHNAPDTLTSQPKVWSLKCLHPQSATDRNR
ncbi:hypothetical protein D030_2814B, partial [Vibrio parahaemolyticus AQ3810]